MKLNVWNPLKKLKDIDGFMLRSIHIGAALAFRGILREALQSTMEEKVPFIYSVVFTTWNQYNANTFMAHDFLPMDCLAMDCGIKMLTADQSLKHVLSRANSENDKKTWNMLPLMYAVSFATSTVWRDTSYRAVVEGFTNNVHCLTKCINELVVALKAISCNDEKDIVGALYTFIEVASVFLLRCADPAKQNAKTGPSDLPSAMVFMDEFLKESTLLTRDMLESSLPYAILRNMWREVYDIKGSGKSAGAAGPEGQAY